MRESVNSPNDPVLTTASGAGGNDFQVIDGTPGIFTTLVGLFMKLWWVAFIVLGLCAISFPYFFPKWADEHEDALLEMGIAANTTHFLKNAASVKWEEAFNKVNIQNLTLVGTGQHSRLQNDPGLKAGAWYNGKLFIMKDYVWTVHLYKFQKLIAPDRELTADLAKPAGDMTHGEASEYCKAQGGRLPTAEELDLSFYWAKKYSQKQGKLTKWLKPNLVFKVNPGMAVWTSDREGNGYTTADNYMVYTPGAQSHFYRDDGFSSEKLGFVCVMDEAKK